VELAGSFETLAYKRLDWATGYRPHSHFAFL